MKITSVSCGSVPQERSEELIYPTKVVFFDKSNAKIVKTRKMLRTEEYILKTVLSCILTSVTIDVVQEEASTYLDQIATHFALLLTTERQPSTAQLNVIFLNIVSSLSNDLNIQNKSID
jgi:hypothetical protein